MFLIRIRTWLYKLQNISVISSGSSQDFYDEELKLQQLAPKTTWLLTNIVEPLFNCLELIYSKYRRVMMYCQYRFIYKNHIIETKLPPGTYQDIDQKLLYGAFTQLCNHVEHDKAYMQYISLPENEVMQLSWVERIGFRFIPNWKNPQLGIDYLLWETTLEEDGVKTSQATTAQEILILYDWWIKRPQRPKLFELDWFYDQLMVKYDCDRLTLDRNLYRFLSVSQCNINIDPKDIDEHSRLLKKESELEQIFYDQDVEMLIRLIKISKHLYT